MERTNVDQPLFIAVSRIAFGKYNAGEGLALAPAAAAALHVAGLIELSDSDVKTLGGAIQAHRARQRYLLPSTAKIEKQIDGTLVYMDSGSGRVIDWGKSS